MLDFSKNKKIYIILFILSFISMWLRMNFPIYALANAGHDDALFVRMAADIGLGRWLGEYNNLTHAKGIGYPIFILINHVLALPLKFAEHACYLFASAYFSWVLLKVNRSYALALIVFVLLAFEPSAWFPGTGGRVIREGIYVTQSLLLLAMAIRLWFTPVDSNTENFNFTSLPFIQLMLMGVIGAWFWLTREEGVWLLPSFFVLFLGCAVKINKNSKKWKVFGFYIFIPLLVSTALVNLVNLKNYTEYGVYKNNDFRSHDYQSGYGAFTRIKHQNWQRYVPFPKDAREIAYEMSSAARELQPFFEGPGGERWRDVGCTQTGIAPCPEILSGWFMWALRDAVEAAGHYESAENAAAFYQRLAQEIDEGCTARPGACFAKRATMVPPWHSGYAMDTLKDSWRVFQTLMKFGNEQPHPVYYSGGSDVQLRAFDAVTNGRLAPTVDQAAERFESPRDSLRYKIALTLTKSMTYFQQIALPASFLAWALWTILLLLRKSLPDLNWVIASALAVAVATRVVLLGFLEATSIPSNNMLYLFPAVPMALALPPVVVLGAWKWWQERHHSARDVALIQSRVKNGTTAH